jgi:hypothetical protein
MESHGEVESEELKHQFSHVEGDLDCKKSLLFPIPNLNTLRKNNCSEKQR